VDTQPHVGLRLLVPCRHAGAVAEDLRAPARQGVEAGLLEIAKDLESRLSADDRHVLDLDGGERLNDHVVGHGSASAAHHVEVEVVVPVGMKPGHDVDLVGAVGRALGRSLGDRVERHLVGALFIRVARERTELAAVAADVGGVDVTVHHEVDALAVDAPACEVGQLADAEQVVAGVQRDAVFSAETLAGGDLLGDGRERGVDQVECGHRSSGTNGMGCNTSLPSLSLGHPGCHLHAGARPHAPHVAGGCARAMVVGWSAGRVLNRR